jgi:hypothetical protein
MRDMPVPQKLLPVGTDWTRDSFRTYTTRDHPSVVIEECLYQMEAYHGPRFAADYARRLADKFDQREVEYQNNKID